MSSKADFKPAFERTQGHEPGAAELHVRNLSARYGRREVLTALNFTVAPGESVALLGENGAGKSTLLRILAGRQVASSGEVLIDGRPGQHLAARRRLAFAPQFLDFPSGLRIHEILRYSAGLYGVQASDLGPLIRDFGLDELLAKPADRLSGGEAKRVSLALALAADAPLLLLDEPAASLDRYYLGVLEQALRGLRGFRTVVFVSHDLPASLARSHRLLRLEAGRLVAEIQPSEGPLWSLRFIAPDCPSLEGALVQRRLGQAWELRGFDADALVRQLVAAGVPFRELEIQRAGPEHD